jgi:hypothetical protein
MDWLILDDEGARSGPFHPLALAAMLEEEELEPHATIEQASSGETYQAVDMLCAVLLAQKNDLQVQLELASEQHAEPETNAENKNDSDLEAQVLALKAENETLKVSLTTSAENNSELPDNLPNKQEWRDTMRSKDQSGKEAEKWKKFFDDESERSKKREHALNEQINKLKQNDTDASHRISQLEKKRKVLEEKNFELQEAIAKGTTDSEGVDPMELITLKRSYNELHDKFEFLLSQLKERTQQMEELYEQRDALELDARHRQDELQLSVQQEREQAQKSRRQLMDLEASHHDLLLAYRDLNDKIVKDRNNPGRSAQTAAPADASSRKPAAKQKRRGKEEKKAAKEAAASKKRLKLT